MTEYNWDKVLREAHLNAPISLARTMLQKMELAPDHRIMLDELRAKGATDARIHTAVAFLRFTIDQAALFFKVSQDETSLHFASELNPPPAPEHYPWHVLCQQMNNYEKILRTNTPSLLTAQIGDDAPFDIPLSSCDYEEMRETLRLIVHTISRKNGGHPQLSDEQCSSIIEMLHTSNKAVIHLDIVDQDGDVLSLAETLKLNIGYHNHIQMNVFPSQERNTMHYALKAGIVKSALLNLFRTLNIKINDDDIMIRPFNNDEHTMKCYSLTIPVAYTNILRAILQLPLPQVERS